MKIIEKIKKLLNKTIENGCTEEEAKASFALARKLMVKYKLEEKDITNIDEENVIKLKLNFNCNVFWIYSLLKVFINHFSVMNFMVNVNDELHCVLFGTKVDVECVKTLMECAYNYVEETSEKYMIDYIELFGVNDSSVKNSFKIGFIKGVNDKYEEQNKQFTNKEALTLIPNEKVQKNFQMFSKELEKQTLEFSETSDKSNMDFLAMEAGYHEGRLFGTTPISDGSR